MRSLDEEIARRLAEAAASGELSRAEGYGKPLVDDAGWNDTPEALRLPFKILKDAGVVPPEVEVMREIAALQAELDALGTGENSDTDTTARSLRQRIAEKRQALALRLEKLRTSGSF